jgi:hypothetical protein
MICGYTLLTCAITAVQKKHVVVVGDSNIVGTPLSVLLRDAGAGTVTVCHRIAYNNLFDDRTAPRMRQQLRADACLPRLPGPYNPGPCQAQSEGSRQRTPTPLPCLDEEPVSLSTLRVQEGGSGATHSVGRDSERSPRHEVRCQMPAKRSLHLGQTYRSKRCSSAVMIEKQQSDSICVHLDIM